MTFAFAKISLHVFVVGTKKTSWKHLLSFSLTNYLLSQILTLFFLWRIFFN